MAKRSLWVLLVGAIVLLSVLVCAWQVTGVRPGAPSAVDLLINLSAFPPDWSIDDGPWSARHDSRVLQDQGAADFAGVDLFRPGAHRDPRLSAHHVIWSFGKEAQAAFEFHIRFRPRDDRLEDDWDGWAYQSEVADRSRFYCWVVQPVPEAGLLDGGWTKCEMVAQYQEFISVFETPVGAEYGMTREDLERILEAIDARMAQSMAER